MLLHPRHANDGCPFVYGPSTVRLTQMQGTLICYKLALAQRTLTYCYALTSVILRGQATG
jgi:hypothetical protein